MEGTSRGPALRWVAVTAVAPVSWGTNYYVTHAFLPADSPLYGAAIRALPAGLLLLALARRLPRGSWWWKSLVLGVLNMGGFFALVYVAAQRLPTSLASTVMAIAPLVMMVIAGPLLGERPRPAHLAGAGAGLGGVCLMLLAGTASADLIGVLASAAAMLMSSLGYVLAKRWSSDVPVLASTAWQLVAGGVVLIPFAVGFDGAPPDLDTSGVLAFAYVSVVCTGLAFAAWFAGLRHLTAGTVGLVGLLNPVTGVLLGTLLAAESLSLRQLLGLALVLGGILLGRPRSGTRPPTPLPTPPHPPRARPLAPTPPPGPGRGPDRPTDRPD
ncbi:DMT family transporter [Streptomyces sp. NPDC002564]|uniref:DMT family transporter n=1 Tax=Streptomyces sp. NPDC002564 TaxID=3364649 RepID=UPI0036AB54F0